MRITNILHYIIINYGGLKVPLKWYTHQLCHHHTDHTSLINPPFNSLFYLPEIGKISILIEYVQKDHNKQQYTIYLYSYFLPLSSITIDL